MTVEQIELRKILTQMLADNGINRETIVDFTKGIIEEKVDKAIDRVIAQTNMNSLIDTIIRTDIRNQVHNEVSDKVRRTLGRVSIMLECKESDAYDV